MVLLTTLLGSVLFYPGSTYPSVKMTAIIRSQLNRNQLLPHTFPGSLNVRSLKPKEAVARILGRSQTGACRVSKSKQSDESAGDLIVEGARQNNLKNISLRIPHNKVTAITGVSGSGKSSLAFDTLFAEGQWRYVESLSTYARMFLEKVDRPDVDRLINIQTGDRDRTEQPGSLRPFYGRHGHGDLRSAALALFKNRQAYVPGLQAGSSSLSPGICRGRTPLDACGRSGDDSFSGSGSGPGP